MKNLTLSILLLLSIIKAEVKINAQDGSEDDRYGQSVALGSESLFVGANRDFNNGINSGSVYVYSYDENMSITFAQKLIPSDYSNDQYFGKVISYSNNWLAISAIYDEDNGIKSGAVYIFEYNGENWTEHSKIIAFDGDSYDRFGYSICINQDRLVVGSIYDDDNGENSGSVYLYEFINNNWALVGKISPNNLDEMDMFGISVSIFGDYLSIGSKQSYLSLDDAGSVSIYKIIDNNLLYVQTIIPDDINVYDHFGSSISMNNNILSIGSKYDDDKGINSGSVYIYQMSDGNWSYYTKITPSDGNINDNFGVTLSLNSNNWLAIGSIDDDLGVNSGSLYIYNNEFLEKIKISASDGSQNDEFSSSLFINDQFLISGAKYDDDFGDDSGSAYLYKYKGCDDILACNYDSQIMISVNEECIYTEYGFDCNGECLYGYDECAVCGGEGNNGDANLDQVVNVSDLIMIIDYIFNDYLDVNFCTIDLNTDEIINITDIVLLIESILSN